MQILRVRVALFAVCAMIYAQVACADVTAQDEYNNRLKNYQTISPGGDTPFGERINPQTGELSFQQTDLVYEGIGPSIAITRSTVAADRDKGSTPAEFGTWRLEIPRIETLVWLSTRQHEWGDPGEPGDPGDKWIVASNGNADDYARCTNFQMPYLGFTADWNGFQFTDASGNVQELLKRSAQNTLKPSLLDANGQPMVFPAVTSGNWQIGCLPNTSNGQKGEAFLAVSPDGTKYWLDYMVGSRAEELIEYLDQGGRLITYRMFVTVYASRVEDRFGNWLQYHYTGDRLTSITASDGRVVTIQWNGSHSIISIIQQPGTDPERKWLYQYGSQFTVVQPDGGKWTYEGVGGGYKVTDYRQSFCSTRDGIPDGTDEHTATVTNPAGASGTFATRVIWHSRSYVPSACMSDISGATYEGNPSLFGTASLVRRTISGPGMATRVWTYAYSPAKGSALRDQCAQSGTCPSTAYVDIRDPAGNRTRHTYSTRAGALNPNRFVADEGKETRTDWYQGSSTLLRSASYIYAEPDRGPWPSKLGEYLGGGGTNPAKLDTWTPLQRQVTTQQGETFAWTANAYNLFARPTEVVKHSGLGFTRNESTTYFNNVGSWVLGQVDTIKVNGVTASKTDYASNDLPYRTYAFGKLESTFAYNAADGTVKSITDGNGNTTAPSDWYRGIPRKVTFADGTFKTATVNPYGWITSVTDEMGATTTYDHDVMARMTKITYPAGDTPAWNATNIGFVFINSDEYGIPAGHWRQTIITGSGNKTTYYDGLLRPVLTREYDTDNAAATMRYLASSYSLAGRQEFSAYAMADAPTMDAGYWVDGGAGGNGAIRALLPGDFPRCHPQPQCEGGDPRSRPVHPPYRARIRLTMRWAA